MNLRNWSVGMNSLETLVMPVTSSVVMVIHCILLAVEESCRGGVNFMNNMSVPNTERPATTERLWVRGVENELD